MSKVIHIGYWNNERNDYPEFSIPEEDDFNNQEIVKRLDKLLNKGIGVEIAYRGLSQCRICGCMNGCREQHFSVGNVLYVVTQGYSHYLSEHGIKPSQDLIDLLEIYNV